MTVPGSDREITLAFRYSLAETIKDACTWNR